MKTITCVRCKMQFGLSDGFYEVACQTEQVFFCPAGHEQHFRLGPTDAEKLRKELDEVRRDRDRAKQRQAMIEDERDAAKRQAAGYKGVATRLKNRAKAGICPCCNRHFENLARHIAAKHPDIDNVVVLKDRPA